MTWYASQIFAQPRSEVIDALKSCSSFDGHIFHVPHLKDWQKEEEYVWGVEITEEGSGEIMASRRTGPVLPPGGLVVARELCFYESREQHRCKWYGEDGTMWMEDEYGEIPNVLYPTAEIGNLIQAVPKPGHLGFLKETAFSCKAVLAYFTRHTWGGSEEYDFAWVYDGTRSREVFYKGLYHITPEEHEEPVPGKKAIMVDAFGKHHITGGDALALMLLHFGLMIPDGYFELHTRGFPWERYRI